MDGNSGAVIVSSESRKIVVAYGSVPKGSGTFTFYRNLRPRLLDHGIDLRCVTIGHHQATLWQDSYADEGCVLLAADSKRVKAQSMAFAHWCDAQAVDIVIGVNSQPILSSLYHLPRQIRVVSRCANAFDHGYRITLSGRERLCAIVATTPRLQHDLINAYGANEDLVRLIPNGIDTTPFAAAARATRGSHKTLRLGFLGRLEHKQKGVFHLPEIVRALRQRNVDFTLQIAGEGKHGPALQRELQTEEREGIVKFIGPLPPGEIPHFFENTDILLFTSHFEGCPNVLLEALMAGCVPVSWLVPGITDYLVDEGKSGFLVAMGDHASMAERVAQLDRDRRKLQSLSALAASDARQRFSSAIAAQGYASLLKEVLANPAPNWNPRPWSEFRADPNFSEPLLKRLSRAIRRADR